MQTEISKMDNLELLKAYRNEEFVYNSPIYKMQEELLNRMNNNEYVNKILLKIDERLSKNNVKEDLIKCFTDYVTETSNKLINLETITNIIKYYDSTLEETIKRLNNIGKEK